MADGNLDEDELTIFPVMILHESGNTLLKKINEAEKLYGRFTMAKYSVGAQWSKLQLLDEEPISDQNMFDTDPELLERLLQAHDPASKSGTGSPERFQYLKTIFPSLEWRVIKDNDGEL